MVARLRALRRIYAHRGWTVKHSMDPGDRPDPLPTTTMLDPQKRMAALRRINQNFLDSGVPTGLTEADIREDTLEVATRTLDALSARHLEEQGLDFDGQALRRRD